MTTPELLLLSAQLRLSQETRFKLHQILTKEHRLLSLLLQLVKEQERQLRGEPPSPNYALLKTEALKAAADHDTFVRENQGTLQSCLILTPEPGTSSSPPSAPSDEKNRTEEP